MHRLSAAIFATACVAGAAAAEPAAVYGPELEGFDYPFTVQRFNFPSQGQSLSMAFMDIAPDKPNGRTVVLLHGKNFCAATWEATITALTGAGYRVVAANFNIPIGRNRRDVTVNAEIDLIAYDGPVLCFIEVKTRASDEFAPPQTNVDLRKRRQIVRAGRGYRRMLGLTGSVYRYDVVTVVWPGGPEQVRVAPRIQLLKNFWTDEQLRKRNWYDARWD